MKHDIPYSRAMMVIAIVTVVLLLILLFFNWFAAVTFALGIFLGHLYTLYYKLADQAGEVDYLKQAQKQTGGGDA